MTDIYKEIVAQNWPNLIKKDQFRNSGTSKNSNNYRYKEKHASAYNKKNRAKRKKRYYYQKSNNETLSSNIL